MLPGVLFAVQTELDLIAVSLGVEGDHPLFAVDAVAQILDRFGALPDRCQIGAGEQLLQIKVLQCAGILHLRELIQIGLRLFRQRVQLILVIRDGIGRAEAGEAGIVLVLGHLDAVGEGLPLVAEDLFQHLGQGVPGQLGHGQILRQLDAGGRSKCRLVPLLAEILERQAQHLVAKQGLAGEQKLLVVQEDRQRDLNGFAVCAGRVQVHAQLILALVCVQIHTEIDFTARGVCAHAEVNLPGFFHLADVFHDLVQVGQILGVVLQSRHGLVGGLHHGGEGAFEGIALVAEEEEPGADRQGRNQDKSAEGDEQGLLGLLLFGLYRSRSGVGIVARLGIGLLLRVGLLLIGLLGVGLLLKGLLGITLLSVGLLGIGLLGVSLLLIGLLGVGLGIALLRLLNRSADLVSQYGAAGGAEFGAIRDLLSAVWTEHK